MNAKKILKFEWEVKSNGNTLLPHRIFSFLSLDFSYEHLERFPTVFFSYAVSICGVLNAKNLQIYSNSGDFRGVPNFSEHQILACTKF